MPKILINKKKEQNKIYWTGTDTGTPKHGRIIFDPKAMV
jgi:hypothetical protein